MAELRFLSRIEQVAAFLRAELAGGRWEGAMPGRVELAGLPSERKSRRIPSR